MNKFIKLTTTILQICICLACIVFIIYSLGWIAFTKRAETYMDKIRQNPSWTITAETPHFTGYPLPPELHFAGRAAHKSGFYINTKDLYYFGFPLLGHIQFFETKDGFNIGSPFWDGDIHIDYAALQIRLPYQFPIPTDLKHIENWQKSDTPISIPKFAIQFGNMSMDGYGTLYIDENFQPIADLDIRIYGAEHFLDNMEQTQGQKNVAVARGLLNMLTQKDEITGETYFATTLKIQNRGVYLGPMRIATLPEINWSGSSAVDNSTLRRRVAPSQ